MLEGVLRTDAWAAGHGAAIHTVADKIAAKIDYKPRVAAHDEERFLRDFYAALRAHLEQKLLFGQRREDKFAK